MRSAANQQHSETAPPAVKARRRGMATNGDTAHDWEREWRSNVSHELAETAEKHERAAIILERVNGRLEEHDRRIAALEARPAQSANEARLWFTTANSGLGTLIAIAAVLISLLIGLLPHLTFH